MATYAGPIDPLWTGMMIPGTNNPMSGYYAEFLVPGTSTRKNAYDDASKQVAVQTKLLNSSGRAQTFGDGVYDIKFYAGDPDADPSLVSVLTLSDYKVRDPLGNVRTITQDTAGSVDDELVLVDTTSGNVTYTVPDATLIGSRSIIVQKISASNTMTVDGYSTQLVNGAATIAYTANNSGGRFVSNGTNMYVPDFTSDAGNADTVDNIHASASPEANKLFALNSSAQYPAAQIAGVNGATSAATNSAYMVRDASARVKVAEGAASTDVPTLNQVIPGLVVWEQQTSGTDGGTFTSGAWQTRVLNTSNRNVITGASLASNQITLPAGTYYVEASAPAYSCGDHAAKLYDTTGAADLLSGTTEWSNSAGGYTQTRSFVRGVFTISVQSVIELRHQCSTTKATDGLGNGASFAVSIFSVVSLWKIN